MSSSAWAGDQRDFTRSDDIILPWMAQTLLAIRTDSGMSLRELAKVTGVHYSALNRIERGERWPRDVDGTIAAYAKVARVRPVVVWQRAMVLWETQLEAGTQ